jgi:hypothetical protein
VRGQLRLRRAGHRDHRRREHMAARFAPSYGPVDTARLPGMAEWPRPVVTIARSAVPSRSGVRKWTYRVLGRVVMPWRARRYLAGPARWWLPAAP